MSGNNSREDNTPTLLSVGGAILGAILAVITATGMTWTDAASHHPVEVIFAGSTGVGPDLDGASFRA